MGQKTNPLIFRAHLNDYECNLKYIEKNYEESTFLFYKARSISSYVERIFVLYGFLIHSLKIEYSTNCLKLTIFFCDRNIKVSKFCKNSNKNLSTSTYVKVLKFIKESIIIGLSKYLQNVKIQIKLQNINKKFINLVYTSKKNIESYKKIVKSLRKFVKIPLFKELLIVSCLSVFQKNSSSFLAKHIAIYFTTNKKRHNQLLVFLNKSLSSLINSSLSKVNGVKIKINGRFNGAPRSKTKIIQIGQIPLQSFSSFVDYYEHVAYTINGTFGIKVWICYNI